MGDDLVKQFIAELQDLVQCRCHEAFKGRGLHDPDCHCDTAEAVKVVADRIEELEAKLKSETERLGREVNLARYGQPDFAWSIHVQAMAELEAKLAKALEEAEKYHRAFAAQSRKLHAVLHIEGVRTTLAELTGGKDE